MGIYNGKSVGYFLLFWEFYFCAKWLVYACMVTCVQLLYNVMYIPRHVFTVWMHWHFIFLVIVQFFTNGSFVLRSQPDPGLVRTAQSNKASMGNPVLMLAVHYTV